MLADTRLGMDNDSNKRVFHWNPIFFWSDLYMLHNGIFVAGGFG
jgi:hypothetical protein